MKVAADPPRDGEASPWPPRVTSWTQCEGGVVYDRRSARLMDRGAATHIDAFISGSEPAPASPRIGPVKTFVSPGAK